MNISSSFLEELDFEGEAIMVEEPKSVKECPCDLTSLSSELALLNNENQNCTERGNQILVHILKRTENDSDEGEANMVVDPNNAKKYSSDLKSLPSGFTTPNTNNQNCTEGGNQILQHILKETENDSDASLIEDKVENSSGSEAGEIDKETEDDSEANLIKCKIGSASGSEAGEIDTMETNEVEDGEISGSVEKQTVCKFFIRGNCYFGPQCQFLHVSNKVYNMFDQPPKKLVLLSKQPICSNPPPQPIENSSWEKGLETAKAMIISSIKKRMYDVEFEDKKLYISPESPPSLVYCREKALSKKHNLNSTIKSVKNEPLKVLKGTQDKKKERPNTMMGKERSHYDFKWVDPWMRSNKKDPISYTSSSKHRKRHCSISSTSSVENVDRSSVYEKLDAERSKKKKRSFSKSHSRSCSRSSRSQSSSRTHSSYSEHSQSAKRSPSYRKFKRSKRKSSSLEKWFKKEVSTARRSRSLSCSSINSLKSYGSSVTVSSLSCSSSGSLSSANQKNQSVVKKIKKSPETKVPEAPIHPRIETSSIDHIRAYIRDSKRKILSQKPVTDPVPDEKSVKLECKPLSKKTKNKNFNNAAFKELFRYQNIKFSGSAAKKMPTDPQTLKCKDLDSPSDCKKISPSNPRRNIILNLQPPKAHKKKGNELPSKQPSVSETAGYEKEIQSKKESLLKQLKLVEQAIAKKKNLH